MSRKDLKILREEPRWLLVYKPAKQHADSSTTVRNALAFTPAHRIDFETQGLLLLAREDSWPAYHELFSQRAAVKIYLGGAADNSALLGHHEGFVGGRYRSSKKTRYSTDGGGLQGFHSVQPAEHIVTLSSVNAPFKGKVYEIDLRTGCRHQIRCFFAAMGSPLFGDTLYGSHSAPALELVSWSLSFVDPFSHEPISVSAPIELISLESDE